jgi:coenzyme F420-reducing hydrogenase beta subunit
MQLLSSARAFASIGNWGSVKSIDIFSFHVTLDFQASCVIALADIDKLSQQFCPNCSVMAAKLLDF